MNTASENLCNLNYSPLQVNSNVLATDNSLVNRVLGWETEAFARTREGLTTIHTIARAFLRDKVAQLSESQGSQAGDPETLMERWLSSAQLDTKDVATAVEDFLLAGVHTSAHAAAFLLYNLATHPAHQERLARQCRHLLELSSGAVTRDTLARATLAAACLKESLRLHPVSVATGRQLTQVRGHGSRVTHYNVSHVSQCCEQDTVFSGYSVPAGTVVIAYTGLTSRMEKYFAKADQFNPDR